MARGQRYSRILKAAQLYSAVDNYIKYVQDSAKHTTGKIGKGQPRPPSRRLFIRPFGIDLPAGVVVPASAAQPSWEAYSGRFGAHTTAAVPANAANIIKVANYSPARVIIVSGRTSAGVEKKSRITGLPYKSYGGTSTSIPFGKTADGESEQEAFETIRTALLAANPALQISLKTEDIRY